MWHGDYNNPMSSEKTYYQHERTTEDIEIMKNRVLESLAKIDEATIINENEVYLVLDNVYSEESEGENDQQQEQTDQMTRESFGQRREMDAEKSEEQLFITTTQSTKDECQDRNVQPTMAENQRKEGAAIIDRDLVNFLRLGRKHDVWKEEILGTKAEIKRLEMEIRRAKRRQEDRDQ